MLRPVGLSRICRKIKGPTSRFICSAQVKKLKKMKQDIDFHDNSKKTSISPEEKPKNMSGYIIDFIKRETRYLASSIAGEGRILEPDVNLELLAMAYLHLDPKIKSSIDEIFDPYNKLALALTYDPFQIDPYVYMGLYKQMNTDLDEQHKRVLFERLIYHRQYSEFWNVALKSMETLSDIEDYIDVVLSVLVRNKNLEVGAFELLLSFPPTFLEITIFRTIVDTISHKTGTNSESFYSFMDETQVFDWLHDEEKCTIKSDSENFYKNLLGHRNKIERLIRNKLTSPEDLDNFMEGLLKDESISEYNGIIDFLLRPVNHIIHIKGTKSIEVVSQPWMEKLLYLMLDATYSGRFMVNEYDFGHLLGILSPQTSSKLYDIYSKNHLNNSTFINRIFKSLLEDRKNKMRVMNCYSNYFQTISEDLVMKTLVFLFRYDKAMFPKACNKMRNNSSRFPKSSMESLIDFMEPHLSTVDDYYLIISSFNKSDLASNILSVLLRSAMRKEFRETDRIEIYHRISQHVRLTSYDLNEMLRLLLLKEQIMDLKLVHNIFDSILNRCWNKKQILKRKAENYTNTSIDDFRLLFQLCSKTERDRLHNRIRAIGQTFSLLSVEKASLVLNSLHEHVNSEDFTFVKSKFGRNYINNNIVSEYLRFVDRNNSDNLTEGIKELRDLIESLKFSVRIVQCFMYKRIIKEDPNKSLVLLDIYKSNTSNLSNDLMRSVMSGILNSEKLSRKGRLALFERFHHKSRELGYKNTLMTSTALEVIKLVIKISEESSEDSRNYRKWVMDFAYETRVPRPLIQNLFKKLSRRHLSKQQ